MKYGTFIGIDRVNRKIKGPNREQMGRGKYMTLIGIKDPGDIIGPFETIITIYNYIQYGESWLKKCSEEGLHIEALKLARREAKKLAQTRKGRVSTTWQR
jgi:hypothetical protein